MKITLAVLAMALSLSTGCVITNSGNLAHDVKPLPYKAGEESVVHEESLHQLPDGRVEMVNKTITKSGLAVNEEQNHHKLDVAEAVGVERARGNSGGGFWKRLFAPSPHIVGTGGYAVTSGGGGNANTVWRSQ